MNTPDNPPGLDLGALASALVVLAIAALILALGAR